MTWDGETPVPDKYRSQVKAGFGIWMDNDWNKHGWNATDFSKNYFKPEGFGESVRLALTRTDEYVWIYTEKPRWWTNEQLPAAYVKALEAARRDADSAREPSKATK